MAAPLVRFAPRGKAVLAVAREVEAKVLAEWTAHLGAARMNELCASLARLREITDPWA